MRVAAVNDINTLMAVSAERAFLAVLDGSCRTPIAGHARVADGKIFIRGLILKPDGSQVHETTRQGELFEAVALAQDAGQELKDRGGPEFFRTR
jgi:hydroxymethylbilane synthase